MFAGEHVWLTMMFYASCRHCIASQVSGTEPCNVSTACATFNDADALYVRPPPLPSFHSACHMSQHPSLQTQPPPTSPRHHMMMPASQHNCPSAFRQFLCSQPRCGTIVQFADVQSISPSLLDGMYPIPYPTLDTGTCMWICMYVDVRTSDARAVS